MDEKEAGDVPLSDFTYTSGWEEHRTTIVVKLKPEESFSPWVGSRRRDLDPRPADYKSAAQPG